MVTSKVQVTNNAELSRYEGRADGTVVGYAEYRLEPGKIVFPHTKVQPEYEGRGYGSVIVKAALEDVKDKGLVVVPTCPFVARYIERHQEYAHLLDADNPADPACEIPS